MTMSNHPIPPGAVECPKCHAMTMRDTHCGVALRGEAKVVAAPVVEPATAKGKKPNKTEQRYYDRYLAYKDARYEALTFHMANGHKYTPDWVVFEVGRPIECIECKGGYRFHSQGRARLAFDQARQEFDGLRWTWAKWDSKSKKWEVER